MTTSDQLDTERDDSGSPGKKRYVLEDQIGFLLRKANQRHRSIFSSRVENSIAPSQFAALAKLHQLGPLSQNHLGRLIALDSATIKGVVNRLAQAEYVTSERSDDDARLRIIDLTEKGHARIEGLLPLAEEITSRTLAPLNDREAAALHRLLGKISEPDESSE